MRYVIVLKKDCIESFWCYYTDCDTCSSRFQCYTNSALIINDCIHMTSEQIKDKLRSHGINVHKLAEF